MAREGCNLDKDEAEILKPSASSPSSSSSTAPPPPQSSQPSSLFLKPPPEVQRKQEPEVRLPTPRVSVGCKRKKEEEEDQEKEKEKLVPSSPTVVRQVNRCRCCQRKVGLTGFRCRCGDLFCARHRYSDAHGCPYDYKAAGREEISRNNPVVRAPKIIKI